MALTEAPVLSSPKFSKDLLTFYFSLQETIDAVLLQNNCEVFEQPIYLFSQALRDMELKYSLMEKQAYELVKELKSFRIYILHSHIIAYVSNTTVKGNILEYDLEIMPTK